MKRILPVGLLLSLLFACNQKAQKPGYLDTNLSFEQRADDLVSRMTLDEKIIQMEHNALEIPRLNIPFYNWSSEGLHGIVNDNGYSTVFPQVIAMAATWDPELIQKEADVISTEARAWYYYCIANNIKGIHNGLTFWAPNINIFRDPRWGRGQETYGEDPYLTAKMSVAFVKGMQGNDPKYFKVIATPKHYAVHSGPESERHAFNAVVSKRDLYETYLPAFEACVREGGAFSVMGAYSSFMGVPCCASDFLLTETLRKNWGFKGYVVSDCGAIGDIYAGHKYVSDLASAAAASVKAGCDITCGSELTHLKEAVQRGLITEKEIDVAVTRLMLARMKLGMFDPPEMVPYSKINMNDMETADNQKLSLQVAHEGMVLLKNEKNILPLDKKKIKSVAVIGPYIKREDILYGEYNGKSKHYVTFLDGIKNKLGTNVQVEYTTGAIPYDKDSSDAGNPKDLRDKAIEIARKADVVILFAGISANLEDEEADVHYKGFSGGDRTTLDIPDEQLDLMKALKATGKPIILVLTSGSALGLNWESENIPAILQSWYPGEKGGDAVADVLFGDYNPAGRLPVTFYKSVDDLPAFTDYNMEGRTYRYFSKKPVYPFGYGLSYTKFDYTGLKVSKASMNQKDSLMVTVDIKNTGNYNGDEVVQLYVRALTSKQPQPIKSLKGFKRITVNKGESKTVELKLKADDLKYFDEQKNDFVVEPGKYEIQIGASSEDIRQKATVEIKD